MRAFPRLEIEALGYHVETHGQKGFNGVAILSKLKPEDVLRGLPGDDSDEQSRYIEAVFSVPSGAIRWPLIIFPTATRPMIPSNIRTSWPGWSDCDVTQSSGFPGGAAHSCRRLQRHPGAA